MKKSVFVLEDNADLRELFTILLEEESYKVSAFASVGLFKKQIANSVPDIFILDVMLPDGNGAEVCGMLKASPKTANIPVIMVSANHSLADIKKECQADDFLSKPFDIDQFINKVNSYVH